MCSIIPEARNLMRLKVSVMNYQSSLTKETEGKTSGGIKAKPCNVGDKRAARISEPPLFHHKRVFLAINNSFPQQQYEFSFIRSQNESGCRGYSKRQEIKDSNCSKALQCAPRNSPRQTRRPPCTTRYSSQLT